MEKDFKVIWAPRAKQQANSAITYCLKQFGKKTALQFIDKLEMNSLRIKNNPFIGVVESAFMDRPKEYRSLVEGYYKLIYTIEKESVIHIVLLWDCRQDPDKLKISIKELAKQ